MAGVNCLLPPGGSARKCTGCLQARAAIGHCGRGVRSRGLTAAALAITGVVSFRKRRMDELGGENGLPVRADAERARHPIDRHRSRTRTHRIAEDHAMEREAVAPTRRRHPLRARASDSRPVVGSFLSWVSTLVTSFTAALSRCRAASPAVRGRAAAGWAGIWCVLLYWRLTAYAMPSSALAALGDPRDRDAIRIGYGLAFPGVVLCAVLLVLDLGRPQRFWHMVFMSHYFPEPIFKHWSPISLGAWVLSVFGALAFVSFVGLLVETGRLRWGPVVRLSHRLRGLPDVVMAWACSEVLRLLPGGLYRRLEVASVKPIWHNAIHSAAWFPPLRSLDPRTAAHAASRPQGSRTPIPQFESWSTRAGGRSESSSCSAAGLVPLGSLARPFITGAYGALFWARRVLTGLLAPIVLDLAGGGADIERKRAVAGRAHPGVRVRSALRLVMAPSTPRFRHGICDARDGIAPQRRCLLVGCSPRLIGCAMADPVLTREQDWIERRRRTHMQPIRRCGRASAAPVERLVAAPCLHLLHLLHLLRRPRRWRRRR